MRQILPYSLWLGNVGDARDLRTLHASGIEAVVDLALDEKPATFTRELVYCRFPIVDGSENAPWLLRLAVRTTATLLKAAIPTLVYCGHWMSRSPAIAAAALAQVTGKPAQQCLEIVLQSHGGDVTPALWHDVLLVLNRPE